MFRERGRRKCSWTVPGQCARYRFNRLFHTFDHFLVAGTLSGHTPEPLSNTTLQNTISGTPLHNSGHTVAE